MTVPALEPALLQAFIAVAEQLSFTRAAVQLHRTQASISLQIKRLEQRLGTELLLRSTVRVALTPAGEGFLVDARRILALQAEAVARLSGRRQAGRLRLGIMEDYGTRLLPALLADAARQFPLVQVEMEIGLTARMLKRLGAAFDAVVAMHPLGTGEGDLICREEAVWVAAADRAPVTVDPLPVALSDPDCLFRQWAAQALDQSGRPWRLAYVSTSQAAVEAIVRQGLAVTVMKSRLVRQGLRILGRSEDLPALPGAEIRLHRNAGLAPVVSLVLDRLAEGLRAGTRGMPAGA